MIDIQLPLFYSIFISKTDCLRIVNTTIFSVKTNSLKNLTLVFTNNKKIQKLNNEYRKIDCPTDVLSFSFENADRVDEDYLGDVIISIPRAISQSKEHRHSIKDELSLLIVHGVLHLLGYDHLDTKSKQKMWAIQDKILTNLGINTRQLDI